MLTVIQAIRQAVGQRFHFDLSSVDAGVGRAGSMRHEVIQLGEAVVALVSISSAPELGWQESRIPTLTALRRREPLAG